MIQSKLVCGPTSESFLTPLYNSFTKKNINYYNFGYSVQKPYLMENKFHSNMLKLPQKIKAKINILKKVDKL